MIKKLIGLVVLSLSLQAALFAEGLAPETRVYTYYGALELQELWVGIEVQCLSAEGKIVMGEVEAIEKIEAPVYYTFIVNGKKYGTSGTQLFYCVNQQKWLKFCEFEPDKDFVVVDYRKAGRIENCQEVLPVGCVYDKKAKSMEEFLDLVELIPGLSEPRYVYRISIKDHHTFFIDGGILCHNWLVLVPPLYYLAAEFLIMTGVSVVLSAGATYVVTRAAEAVMDMRTKSAHERSKKSHNASREALNNPNNTDNQPSQETLQSDQGSNQETKQEPNNQDPEDPNNGGKKAFAGAAGAAATNNETRKAVVDGAAKVVETGSKVIDKASKAVSKVSNAAGKASKAASRASRVAGKASKAAGKASDVAGKNSNTAGNLSNTLDNASKTGNAAVVKPAPNATPKATTQQAAPGQSSAKPATQQATPKQATTPKQPTQNATQKPAQTQQPANTTTTQGQSTSQSEVNSNAQSTKLDPRLDKDSSTPVGRKGMNPEQLVQKGTNAPTEINGCKYSGHAIDQMQGRGIPPSAVKNTLETGVVSPGDTPQKLNYYDEVNNISVVINKITGLIITTGYGKL